MMWAGLESLIRGTGLASDPGVGGVMEQWERIEGSVLNVRKDAPAQFLIGLRIFAMIIFNAPILHSILPGPELCKAAILVKIAANEYNLGTCLLLMSCTGRASTTCEEKPLAGRANVSN
jgi:hypothetical protein